jgi:hypothetical protein
MILRIEFVVSFNDFGKYDGLGCKSMILCTEKVSTYGLESNITRSVPAAKTETK